MKPRTINPDPFLLDRANVITLRQSAVFIHIGRCGLLGTTIPAITECLGYSGGTVTNIIDTLQGLELIMPTSRANSQGRARNYVVTVKGWELLTAPADFSMFPHIQVPMLKTRKAG